MSEAMTCGRARRLLWPDQGPRRATDEVMRARSHAAECDGCRRFPGDMASMAAAVHRSAARPQAPAAVRERLFQAVARARASAPPAPANSRIWLWAAAVAGALVVGALAGGLALQHRGPEDAMAILVEDHLRAVKGDGIASSDSLTVALWLAARVRSPVNVPLFPAARLRGGRVANVEGDRGAVLEYELNGRSLSYYIMPAGRAGSPVGSSTAAGMPALHHASRAGYRAVAWQDADLVHALVADLPQAQLTHLAHYCIRQAMSVALSQRRPLNPVA